MQTYPGPSLIEEASLTLPGVVVGLVAGFNEEGEPLVDYPGNPGARFIPARSTVTLTEQDLGRDAVLIFEDGDPARPIILGLLQPAIPAARPGAVPEMQRNGNEEIDLTVDGRRVAIEGEDEIVLRCGKASITLRRNGRVIIRGDYVESRSKGTNRVKGSTVLIN